MSLLRALKLRYPTTPEHVLREAVSWGDEADWRSVEAIDGALREQCHPAEITEALEALVEYIEDSMLWPEMTAHPNTINGCLLRFITANNLPAAREPGERREFKAP